MKLQKVIETSTRRNHSYYVSPEKRIIIHTDDARMIDTIVLLNLDMGKDDETFSPKGVWFLENIAEGEDCEVLNIDSLMIMIAQEEHGCVRA